MTPKSLLRHKRARSRLDEHWPRFDLPPRALGRRPGAARAKDRACLKDSKIKRVVLCSGKVYYDLYEEREQRGIDDVYLMRVEQLYPFPARALIEELSRFPQAEIVWCQEEPKNMGAWSFIEPNLEWVLDHIEAKASSRPRYAGRPASAATATGLDEQTQGGARRRSWTTRFDGLEDLEPRRAAADAGRGLQDGDRDSRSRAGRIGDRGDRRPVVQAGGRRGRRSTSRWSSLRPTRSRSRCRRRLPACSRTSRSAKAKRWRSVRCSARLPRAKPRPPMAAAQAPAAETEPAAACARSGAARARSFTEQRHAALARRAQAGRANTRARPGPDQR